MLNSYNRIKNVDNILMLFFLELIVDNILKGGNNFAKEKKYFGFLQDERRGR